MSVFAWHIIRVRGHSMPDTLPAGSFAIFRQIKTPKVHDVVLVNHPKYGRIVKRIDDATDGHFTLRGESDHSTTRFDMGQIVASDVLGRLVWVIQKPSR